MSSVIAHLPRGERKYLLKLEAKRRASGDWGEWHRLDLPAGLPNGRGWNKDIRVAIKNAVFCVMVRPLADGNQHLGVSSLSGIRPSWHEMQRIKNEIAGSDAIGMEIYPKQSDVVDGADMFHIFVMPSLPSPEFTIASDGAS